MVNSMHNGSASTDWHLIKMRGGTAVTERPTAENMLYVFLICNSKNEIHILINRNG